MKALENENLIWGNNSITKEASKRLWGRIFFGEKWGKINGKSQLNMLCEVKQWRAIYSNEFPSFFFIVCCGKKISNFIKILVDFFLYCCCSSPAQFLSKLWWCLISTWHLPWRKKRSLKCSYIKRNL